MNPSVPTKQHKATKRPRVLERNAAEVFALLLDRESQYAVAKYFGVHVSSVMRFVDRHAEELAVEQAKVDRAVVDVALRDKERRIREADADYWRLQDVIDARAGDTRYDEPGYSTGTMVHQVKSIGSGPFAHEVDEYKVDTAVIDARRALRREVAEELGQIERPPTISITNDNRKYVLQWDDGTPAQ